MIAHRAAATDPTWLSRPGHRAWLTEQASGLFGFFERAMLDPRGGFHTLDVSGRPSERSVAGQAPQMLHRTARMIYSFSLAALMGRPGARTIVDHGMRFLWERFRDDVHGGYFGTVTSSVIVDEAKEAYGHAFVLLAASGARMAGHPDADRMLADILDVIEARFWDEVHGASVENASRDWSEREAYRGQNSNMHLTEALMAAFDATGETVLLSRAERVASWIVGRHAREAGWRIPEHYTTGWQVDRDYAGSPGYRPHGTTPGHALEWCRLLVQLWRLGGRRHDWMPEAARSMFAKACTDAWIDGGGRGRDGFCYTLDWDGRPAMRQRFWWPHCEAIGAAAVLGAGDVPGAAGDGVEAWYRRVWDVIAGQFIDRVHGGWHREVDADGASPGPADKTDLYHSVQACLIPLHAQEQSVAAGLRRDAVPLD